MSGTLTDEQYDWAAQFCGIDLRDSRTDGAEAARPAGPGASGPGECADPDAPDMPASFTADPSTSEPADAAQSAAGVPDAAEATTGSPGNAGDAPQNPFDVPAVQVEIDKLAIEPLRGLASAAAGDAFTKYMLALAQIQQELKEAEAAAAKKAQITFDIVVAMAIAIATPLTAGAAAAVAGPALQASLGLAIAGNTQRILQTAGVKNTTAITDQILNAATADSIDRLAKKYSASDGQKIISAAITGFTKTVSVAGHDDVDACTLSYVKEIEKAIQASKGQLNLTVAGANGFSQLLQIYHSFSTSTKESYYSSLRKQVDVFKQNVAPFIVLKARLKAKGALREDNPDQLYDGENVVKMNAYGRMRFARIDFTGSRSPLTSPLPIYRFIAWVPPEGEQAAAAVALRELDPARIRGHLPDPGVP